MQIVMGILVSLAAMVPWPLLAAEGPAPKNVIVMTDGVSKPLLVQVGRTTTVKLADPNEFVLDVVIDKTHFKARGLEGKGFAYITPKANAKGISTNLHLITQYSHDYVFDVHEVSKDGGHGQDTVVVGYKSQDPPEDPKVETCDPRLEASLHESQELLKKTQSAFEVSQADAAKAKQEAAARVDPSEFLAELVHDYKISKKLKAAPFNVTEVWHDKRFTYIRTTAQVKAALYTHMDGKPAMVWSTFANGVYTVPRILDYGYLQLGKTGGKGYDFKRKEN